MKTAVIRLLATFVCSTFVTLTATAGDLESLAGKWVAERKDDQGRALKQTLEIKNSKFKFQLTREGSDRALYAEGEVKAESLGPFKAARFYNIQGGTSASDLQPVDDERVVIYTLGYNELTTAVNFDKERQEPPMVTRYTKAAEETGTLVIDKIVMHKTPQSADWYLCFETTAGDAPKRFNLPDKTWHGDEVTIATDLSIPGVSAGQTCKFVMKLDDVAGDECTEEMDNKSTGSFAVTANGSETFKPEDGWSYTVYWRLK